MMEARRGIRYAVELDCTISAVPATDVRISGKTVNMSNRGVLVEVPRSDTPPPALDVGGLARVIVELPGVPYFRHRSLECMCRVVRSEEAQDCWRVAFSVWRHYFRDPSETGQPA